MIEHHDTQLIHQHGWSKIGHRASRHTSPVGNLVREVLDHGVNLGNSTKRVVQRQLLPPSDHAL